MANFQEVGADIRARYGVAAGKSPPSAPPGSVWPTSSGVAGVPGSGATSGSIVGGMGGRPDGEVDVAAA
jgi:hypothetical protein